LVKLEKHPKIHVDRQRVAKRQQRTKLKIPTIFDFTIFYKVKAMKIVWQWHTDTC
jgi:hypothetical protein